MPLPRSLRAFRHRDYRLYFAGQGISQTGTWLQLIATSWLIYDLTGSAFMLGLSNATKPEPGPKSETREEEASDGKHHLPGRDVA